MKRMSLVVTLFSLLVGLSPRAGAADGAWSNDVDGAWSDANNWLGGVVATGTSSTAYFTNAIAAARTVSNDLPGLEIGGLFFAPTATNGWTLLGNGLNLAVGSGSPVVSVAAGTSTVAAILSGSQGLTKTGAGVLELTGGSQYSGATEINQGTLQFRAGGKVYNAGAAAGTINVNNGGTLAYNVSDVFGVHTANPTATVAVHAGGLAQNVGAWFNTLRNLTLDGGELRANGGASANYPAFQLKGTVTVSGASASLISKTTTVNAFNRIQLGNNTAGGQTTFDVADVTGNAAADLVVAGSFTDGRNTADSAFVASGLIKAGAGTLSLVGNQYITGPVRIDGGELVVTGAALKAGVTLGGGTMLTATWAPGLVGDFYNLGAGQVIAANFTTLQNLNTHLAAMNPSALQNFPNAGTNFDFTNGGWPLELTSLDNFEGRWEGRFNAPTNGTYWFDTASDDGSMMWIDGQLAVNNGFVQGTTRRGSNVVLTAGPHEIVIAYFEVGGGNTMDARVSIPGSGVTNFIANTLVSTPSAIGSLGGDAGSVLNLSNAPLTVAQSSNGVFAGAIVGTNALRKIGVATLTLAADNSAFTGGHLLEGGRLSVSNDANLGSAASPLTFAGGTLRITGTAISDFGSHVVNLPTFNGGIDVVDPSHTFTFSAPLNTPGFLRKYGAGRVGITNANLGGLIVDEGLLLLDGQSVTCNVYGTVGQNAGDNGVLTMIGNSAIWSPTAFHVGELNGSTGRLVVAGNATLAGPAFMPLYVGNAGKGMMTVMDSAFVSNKLQVGFATGTGAGAIHQYGGTVYNCDSAGQDAALGWNAGAYGYYGMFGGNYSNRGWTQVGNSGLGVVQQFGGSYTHLAINGNYDLSRGGTGVVYLAGGTFYSGNGVTLGYNGGVNGLAIFTVDGNAYASMPNNVRMTERHDSRAILNLNGGVLEANQISKTSTSNTALAIVNFDGGTLRARVAGNLVNVGANKPDAVYVYGGGATIDATNVNVTIASDLLAPPGSGVTDIPVTSGGAGYIGAPVVIVSGDGTGATAVAMMDFDTNSAFYGRVTNILVTSPGVNYSATPTVTLHGGGPTTPATPGAVTVGGNGSGGLTKRGSGILTSLGTNTYAGNTIVDDGVLLVATTSSILGSLTLNTNTAGIGVTYPIDQNVINWLTGKLTLASSPGLLALGASSTNDLNLTPLPGFYLTGAGGSFSYSGNLTIPGTNLYLGGANGTLTYVPVIGTGTNVFAGFPGGDAAGVVVLSGANGAYASEMNVRSGTLRGGATNAFGGAAAVVNVAGGTALDVGGQNLGAVQVYVTGTGIGGAGAIVNSGAQQVNALQDVTLAGHATFGGPNRWDIRTASAAESLDLAGYTLTKTAGSAVGLVNCKVRDGNIVINQGMLTVEDASSITGGVGTIAINPAGTLQFWNLSGAVDRPVTIDRGIITAGSGTAAIGSDITLAGATNDFGALAGATLLPLGTIDGAGALRKIYSGTVKLPTNAAYTGRTIVTAGTLELGSADPANGTLSASGDLLVTGGRVLVDFDNGIYGSNPLSIRLAGGSLQTANGVYCEISGPFEFAGGGLAGGVPSATNGCWVLNTNLPVTAAGAIISAPRTQLGVPGGVRFNVNGGASLIVGGTLENPGLDAARTGTLIKAGAGLMKLTATNAYSGPTVIEAGTLALASPGPVAGAALWLDASDAATVTRGAGGLVSQWNDKSGNGRHATQATAASQPVFTTNALAGRTVLTWAGAQLMDVDLSFLANAEYTIVAVEARTNNGNRYFLGTANGSNNNGLHFGYRNDTQFTLAQYGNDIDATVPAYTTQAFDLWCGLLNFGSGHVLYRNGTNVASSVNTTPFTASIGAGRVGTGFGAQYFQGDLAEVLIYNRALTTVEQQAVELYLRNKWLLGLDAAATNILPVNTDVLLASGATFDVGGVEQTVGSLSDLAGGGGSVGNTVAAAAVLTLGSGDKSGVFSGVIADGAGSVALAKDGTGTQTLHGLSTCSGGTALSNGVLLVQGALAGTGTVTVAGGTLGGTGTIGGLVLQLGGTVAPGASSGTLTFLGNYAQGGDLAIEIAGTTPGSGYDRLVVGGAASLFATLTVTTNGYTPVDGDSFTILTASNGVSGSFAFASLPPLSAPELGWKVDYQTNAVVLSVTSAPATSGYDLYAGQIPNAADRGYQNDPDGDGYANLLEYVTGGNPTNSDTVAQMKSARTNGVLALKFSRSLAATDATLYVEGSYATTNDATWTGIATNLAGSWGGAPNVSETGGPDPMDVTVADTDPAATNRFLRLRVTRP